MASEEILTYLQDILGSIADVESCFIDFPNRFDLFQNDIIPLADLPGMEELAAYESTVKKNKFGLTEGTLSGTVSQSIGASDSQSFVITGTPDRTEMRLWATVAPENRQVVPLDDVADDITHSRHGARRYFYKRMDGPEFTATFTPEELIEGIEAGASAR